MTPQRVARVAYDLEKRKFPLQEAYNARRSSLGPAPAHKKPTPKAPPALEAYKEPAGSAGAGAPVARDAAPDLLQLVEARDVEGLAALVGSENFDASALDARNADGLTPLLVAARMRDPKAAELLRVLIARGADLDAPDKLGRSALHLAPSPTSLFAS